MDFGCICSTAALPLCFPSPDSLPLSHPLALSFYPCSVLLWFFCSILTQVTTERRTQNGPIKEKLPLRTSVRKRRRKMMMLTTITRVEIFVLLRRKRRNMIVPLCADANLYPFPSCLSLNLSLTHAQARTHTHGGWHLAAHLASAIQRKCQIVAPCFRLGL